MNMRNILVWAILLVLLLALFNMLQGPVQQSSSGTEINFSNFMERVESGEVDAVTIEGRRITGQSNTGQNFTVQIPEDARVTEQLRQNDVSITAREPQEEGINLLSILLSWFPMLLLIGVWIFFMRQMQGGGKGAMGFGKSKAKLLTEKTGRVTFDDVAGVDEAKEELQEVVEFLKDPSKFQRLGGKIPKGALLVGPPGTGKTLIARAVAGEAGVPFFTISGSDFVEMFVGVGASRVRDMFEQAKKNAPCIIFIDEIDAVGRSRGAGLGGGNDEREQTLNQLLVEMDGFEANEGIILIAATNRPDVLDPALLRPGRFDRQVVVPNPDVTGRERILKVHMREVPLASDVDPKTIARGTPGFSGADLANLVNEAALMAARRNKRVVTMAEFEDAKDKVMMGPERRSMVMTQKEKELTAYHESGHAIVALNVPSADPVHKATIIPRGRALGMVMQLPEGDKMSMTHQEMTSRLAIMMGGRVAEELKFGKENVTSGAASDIKQATRLARAMVTQWGFSEEIGPIDYGDDQGEVFLGQQLVQSSSISAETAAKIEKEVKALVEGGLAHARQILTDKKEDWVTLSEGLLEYETLSGDEIKELLKGIKPYRDAEVPDKNDGGESGGGAVPVVDEDEDSARGTAQGPQGPLEPKPGGA
ncbi:ATP-dependent zinc metalloprotease FtsH [Marinicauda pacifica]|jgi:cell division protease FtsH|uniref:ATP-dependent zinc metalloprotease FtsH n=1 Tax=Marinicauda pacifica TaxID=1133559 RepID=A0A4V3RYY1_9PROT|nr:MULTISPECIES: ATP-dependent zinc metalloprotease FtsH [Marinicauda]TGY92169.1 ATP-dependent metallopeptidase FtsH/Yme1/Tma family protein [Marinicauda pacifica]GGE46542.1 ATP-dependent zinc metalloprotease FtsH [Marinicauda pacifica]